MTDEPVRLLGADELLAAVNAAAEKVQQNREAIERRTAVLFAGAVLGALGFVLAFIGVVALVQAGNANTAAATAQRAIDQNNSERAARTVTACEQQADTALSINGVASAVLTVVDLVNQPNPARPAEAQAALDAFVAGAHTALESANVRVRACDQASIDAFYASNGADGYLP